jgi:hypothetical protein
MRVFYANGRNESDDDVSSACARLCTVLGSEHAVVSGKDDYKTHFSRCGSWDAWQRDVGVGVDYASRAPRYDAFVVPTREVGKATAKILEHALAAGKRVLLIEGVVGESNCRLSPVTGIRAVDAENWKAGWTVDTEPVSIHE